jgi:hypothetical protein
MKQQTAVKWLVEEINKQKAWVNPQQLEPLIDYALKIEKEQTGYTEEQAYEIWKAGQEYWITSGKSITFEDLIEKFKPKAILQPNL